MVHQNDAALHAAWRALSSAEKLEGWRFIALKEVGQCQLHAGRRFPGNEEALLVSFPGVRLPPSRQLPLARGFDVAKVTLPDGSSELVTIGLVREPAGSLELFETMAEDCVRILERSGRATVSEMLDQFLRRVVAWQEFMQRPKDGLLSAEQEVGLFGELRMLEQLLDAGADAKLTVEAWEGPVDGLQDFVLGPGAIEVKTSISTGGFPARIGSIEQLDDAFRQPLYLAAQRLTVTIDGDTLPAFIGRLRHRLSEAGGGELFDRLLLHAGYLDMHAESYVRGFASLQTRLLLIDGSFPRLTPSIVGPSIRRASYELDLDTVDAPLVELRHALVALETI